MNDHTASVEITVNVHESLMFVKYFEYYTIILRGPFFRGHAV